MIDTSGSMSGSRLSTAKEAAKAVINTFSNSDFVGVLEFNSNSNVLVSSSIIRATDSHKEQLVSAINGLTAQGGTNYEAAFRSGFSLLSAAKSDEFGSPCPNAENIFLFLTDG